ncbi:MAG: superoxide dismutase [Bdellovibrionales bacterium]|nr:superoxide dismutase [Bdellovibrionales bacterium]
MAQFTLPDLPYALDALAPTISRETLEYHYGKHHRAYVTKLNTLLEEGAKRYASLEEVIRSEKSGPIFNNAAQVWNHTFYWNCLTPSSGAKNPSGALGTAIDKAFGSFEKFKEAFQTKAAGHFGSGWAWLVKGTDGALSIVTTSDAGTPLTTGSTPIFVADVWEHAYYIDYRNDRAKYLGGLWQIANWEFAASRFG